MFNVVIRVRESQKTYNITQATQQQHPNRKIYKVQVGSNHHKHRFVARKQRYNENHHGWSFQQ